MLFWRVKPLDAILATCSLPIFHRSLGPVQLTMLGIGAIIGTGIFVLTAEAAQKAGPGMMFSFIIAGFVCAVAALCYSELSSMVPVSWRRQGRRAAGTVLHGRYRQPGVEGRVAQTGKAWR